jgi:predicted nucleotidyltransferase component of viral defense system
MTRITVGRLAQHTPPGSQGRYAAIIDIAQDLLLASLHADGTFDHLVFKGGTALRKLYAGSAGRFSTDLDFSVRNPDDDPATVAAVLRESIEGRSVDGIEYHIEDHRGRAAISYQTPFGDVGMLRTKLDIGPAPWLPPDARGWVHLKVHDAYQLPATLPVMALSENMAEKIARLSRRTPARDVYDLVWIASNSPHSGFDRKLVRRLSILKTWVDQHGLNSPPASWQPVAGAIAYDPTVWTRVRATSDFDDESIGMLAVPVPKLSDLATAMLGPYSFLGEPDELERDIIASGAAGRSLVIAQIRSLPGQRFETRELW